GVTPRQLIMKSRPHAALIALRCSGLGIAAGAVAAVAVRAAGAPPEIAATALLQAGESSAELRSRQRSASIPPGCTPEQRAMKSDRHAVRIALRCCCVGCRRVATGAAAGAAAGRVMCGAGAGAGLGGGSAFAAAGGALPGALAGLNSVSASRQLADSSA